MADICQLPEDEAALREYILERVGGEITAEAVTLLQEAGFAPGIDRITQSQMDAFIKTLQDDGIMLDLARLEAYRSDHSTYDREWRKEYERAILENLGGSQERLQEYFDSRSFQEAFMENLQNLKMRWVWLQKSCTAADGVGYEVEVEALLDPTRHATFSDFLVQYRYADILAGRRPFSFERFRGDNKKYGTLLTAETSGFTLPQMDEYMAKFGYCRRSIVPGDVPAAYTCSPPLTITGWLGGEEHNKGIEVQTNAAGTIQQITVLR